MTTLYGLTNCDSCRKARSWLQAQGIEHGFHDFRQQGLPADRLDHWLEQLGWEVLLNRRGSTWRGLSETERSGLDERRARELMLRQPSLIKRPVLEVGAGVIVGFSSAQYEAAFAGAD